MAIKSTLKVMKKKSTVPLEESQAQYFMFVFSLPKKSDQLADRRCSMKSMPAVSFHSEPSSSNILSFLTRAIHAVFRRTLQTLKRPETALYREQLAQCQRSSHASRMVPPLNQSRSYVKSINWNIFSVGGCGRWLLVIMTYRMRSEVLLVKIRFLSGKWLDPLVQLG